MSKSDSKRSSLYPHKWGSGNEILDIELKCFSYECVDHSDKSLRYGNKIILPPEIFRQISRYRLPFPLYFYFNTMKSVIKRRKKLETCKVENKRFLPKGIYCGVIEFTAPKGCVYVPKWIMKAKSLKEGDIAHLISISQLEQGTYVKLKPDNMKVVDILARVGPKQILEQVMTNYATLSNKQRIILKYNNDLLGITVVKTEPNSTCVSVLGAGELVVDFDEPADMTPLSSSQSRTDTKKEEKKSNEFNSSSLFKNHLQNPQKNNHNTIINNDDNDDTLASGDFSNMGWAAGDDFLENSTEIIEDKKSMWNIGKGYSLTENDDNSKVDHNISNDIDKEFCGSCERYIPKKNFIMHSVHCSKGYSRCKICSKRLRSNEMKVHLETHESIVCSCGISMEKNQLENHQKHNCSARKKNCQFCNNEFPLLTIVEHEVMCGDELYICDICGEEITKRRKNDHRFKCMVICGECGESIRNIERQHHQLSQCIYREIICDFCQLSYKSVDYDKHSQYCGNRTEQCENCGKWIKLNQMKEHNKSNCQINDLNTQLEDMEQDLINRMNEFDLTSPPISSSLSPNKSIKKQIMSKTQSQTSTTKNSNSTHIKRSKKLYHCPNCKKTCKSDKELQDHLLTSCISRGALTPASNDVTADKMKKIAKKLNPVRPGSARRLIKSSSSSSSRKAFANNTDTNVFTKSVETNKRHTRPVIGTSKTRKVGLQDELRRSIRDAKVKSRSNAQQLQQRIRKHMKSKS